ncbi:aspartyl-phosphate phosphatase Spo0E family protein [Xylanibacillus composti]|uniref:Aspartyl-phosphate phosphatase Spo0E family protein n=1 Tax=Xylanibacillus composti TaxID=1572762 RepID=A0A8J4M3H2_9BACL|nr:aspartyl-phosphate phosphatase Spo0E family protein [Xylanibacillus composti]MDT9726932.1 aspartyl-phosphate phosphatase Spo0E family protein [Xylanibacillus composti]GIQ70100.1 hypothetical protein XYCOK13_29240 [Xylanibacillus composti]
MSRLLRILEEERRKLNKLGEESLERFIALSDNPEIQEQSRKLDKLVLLHNSMKTKRSKSAQ